MKNKEAFIKKQKPMTKMFGAGMIYGARLGEKKK
jgi:hypothetical protein